MRSFHVDTERIDVIFLGVCRWTSRSLSQQIVRSPTVNSKSRTVHERTTCSENSDRVIDLCNPFFQFQCSLLRDLPPYEICLLVCRSTGRSISQQIVRPPLHTSSFHPNNKQKKAFETSKGVFMRLIRQASEISRRSTTNIPAYSPALTCLIGTYLPRRSGTNPTLGWRAGLKRSF